MAANGPTAPGCRTLHFTVPPFETCPGSLGSGDGCSLELDPSVTFLTQVICTYKTPRRSMPEVEISLMWRVYVKFPLSTGWSGSGTATGISSAMGGPHLLESLAAYTTLEPLTSIRLCPYCNQACNGRDQLMNHLCFHYRMVLICPICAGCGSNSWRTIKSHVEVCAQQ